MIRNKPDYSLIYEKIRLKKKILLQMKNKLNEIKAFNKNSYEISGILRSISDLEIEIKKLSEEFKGNPDRSRRVINLSFDDVMEYIGFLSSHPNGNVFKVRDLLNSIDVNYITDEQKELLKERKKYLENTYNFKF